jgi:hypothetical protein
MKVYQLLISNILLISTTIFIIKLLRNNIRKSKNLLSELNQKTDEQYSLIAFETQGNPAKEYSDEKRKEYIEELRNEIQKKKGNIGKT